MLFVNGIVEFGCGGNFGFGCTFHAISLRNLKRVLPNSLRSNGMVGIVISALSTESWAATPDAYSATADGKGQFFAAGRMG